MMKEDKDAIVLIGQSGPGALRYTHVGPVSTWMHCVEDPEMHRINERIKAILCIDVQLKSYDENYTVGVKELLPLMDVEASCTNVDTHYGRKILLCDLLVAAFFIVRLDLPPNGMLASPRMRNELLAATITFNKANPQDKLNSSHLGVSGDKTPVYLAEHLSPANKVLHAAARKAAKERGYKYVWVRGGKIYARKTEDSEYIYIKNMDSIKKIV